MSFYLLLTILHAATKIGSYCFASCKQKEKPSFLSFLVNDSPQEQKILRTTQDHVPE